MKHPITTTKNGVEVYVNLIHSEVSVRISRQPYLLGLIKDGLSGMSLKKPELVIEHDFGRTIGNAEVVETTDKDVILYAQILKNDTYTRFVKNRRTDPSSFLTMILKRDEDGNYELVNTWIGKMTPPLPGEADEEPTSKTYWDNHAVVMDGQPLQLRTLTKDSPY